MPASFTITDTQKFAITLEFDDGAGNPTAAPGPVAWTTSDPTVVTVTPSADGQSVDVSSAGKIGTATITVTATMPDGSNIFGALDVNVIGGAAKIVILKPGAAVEK